MEVTKESQSFWNKLESSASVSIPSHIKNGFHLCGYSNALSFKAIETEQISEVQTFIRDELMDMLLLKCEKLKVPLNENDKKHFFGIFDTNTEKFRFLTGEVSLIKELVTIVRETIEKYGNAFFKPNQRKLLYGDTNQLSVGLFFARTEKTLQSVSFGNRTLDHEEMKEDLFSNKLKPIFESVPEELVPIHPVAVDIVAIIKYGNKVRADVKCVFCKQKTICVQCDLNESAFYWNPSNFKKHIVMHIKQILGGQYKSDESDFIDDEDQCPFNESSDGDFSQMNNIKPKGRKRKANKLKIIYPKKNLVKLAPAEKKSSDSITLTGPHKELLDQMSQQNLKNIKSTLQNVEKRDLMTCKLENDEYKVLISPIPMDGSCLFGSVVHQLHGFKIGSEQHSEKTSELRAEVIAYIQTHFERFKHALKGRIMECDNIDTSKMDQECRIFLSHCLSRPNIFGGFESLLAISEIKKTNIVTLTEFGDCIMAIDFNKEYTQTLILAHRLTGSTSKCEANKTNAHNTNRQHYDTVSEIEKPILYKMAEYLNKRISQRAEYLNKLSKPDSNMNTIFLNTTVNDE